MKIILSIENLLGEEIVVLSTPCCLLCSSSQFSSHGLMFEIQRKKRQWEICKTSENTSLVPIVEERSIKEKISIALKTPDIKTPFWGFQDFPRIGEGSGGAWYRGQGMTVASIGTAEGSVPRLWIVSNFLTVNSHSSHLKIGSWEKAMPRVLGPGMGRVVGRAQWNFRKVKIVYMIL